MSDNPINLAFRFLLELALLAAVGQWGLLQDSGTLSWAYAAGTVIAVAALWGGFRTPDDAGRSGKPLVAVSGRMRLLLEWTLFLFGTWCLYAAGRSTWAGAFIALVAIHYALSYDRTIRMLRG